MKKLQKGIAVSMALAVLMTSALSPEVFAAQSKQAVVAKQDKNASKGKAQEKAQSTVKGKDETNASEAKTSKNTIKINIDKALLEAQKDELEAQKDKLEEQKDLLEKQYEAAKESENTELAAQLKVQLEQIKKDFEAMKQQFSQKRAEVKASIKDGYTAAELASIKAAGDKLKKNNKNITVLPVENIIIKGKNVKFDTPPVIKSGRTLIPVKAISQAFGAEVKWIAAEKKVIITKGTTEIILILDSYKMYVNGVETKLDVPATSMNSRTVVPLKFIVENLGLKVKWNSDTKDIEIEQPAPVTPPATTTDSAITVTGSAIEVNSGTTVNTDAQAGITDTTGTAVTVETLR